MSSDLSQSITLHLTSEASAEEVENCLLRMFEHVCTRMPQYTCLHWKVEYIYHVRVSLCQGPVPLKEDLA